MIRWMLLVALLAPLALTTGCKRKDGKIKQPGKSQYALVVDEAGAADDAEGGPGEEDEPDWEDEEDGEDDEDGSDG